MGDGNGVMDGLINVEMGREREMYLEEENIWLGGSSVYIYIYMSRLIWEWRCFII